MTKNWKLEVGDEIAYLNEMGYFRVFTTVKAVDPANDSFVITKTGETLQRKVDKTDYSVIKTKTCVKYFAVVGKNKRLVDSYTQDEHFSMHLNDLRNISDWCEIKNDDVSQKKFKEINGRLEQIVKDLGEIIRPDDY